MTVQMMHTSLSIQLGKDRGAKKVFKGLILFVKLENSFLDETVATLTMPFIKQLLDFEKQTELSLTFRVKAGVMLISIPTEFPNFSFYWNDLRYDFTNFMECMQFMFDVLDILKHDECD